MLVPDYIRKSVAFIGVIDRFGKFQEMGTVFFVGKSYVLNPEYSIGFMVTAKHVIDGIKELNTNDVVVRLNHRINGVVYGPPIPIDAWYFHPTDSSVDVAVFIGLPSQEEIDFLALPLDKAMTPNHKDYGQIGCGDEIFITGLFVHHYGKQRNIPIIRTGNIAMMPEEPVYLKKFGEATVYLVEARSISGLSGSPVFIHKSSIEVNKTGVFAHTNDRIFLLGLIHGHFRDEVDYDSAFNVDEDKADEKINAGIAIVVPVEKILEVINQPKIQSLLDQVYVNLDGEDASHDKDTLP